MSNVQCKYLIPQYRLGLENTPTASLQKGKISPNEDTRCSPEWRPAILKNGMLVAEQSVTRQLKWSSDLQYSTLAYAGLNGRAERPNPIDQLVMSSPDICMIALTVACKLQTSNQTYFIFKVLEADS